MAKMAYKHKGMRVKADEKASCDSKSISGKASMAPEHKASKKHIEPAGPFSYPKSGEQSAAPGHKKKGLPSKDAPAGVKGVNAGSSVALPKGGGVGETEV